MFNLINALKKMDGSMMKRLITSKKYLKKLKENSND